MAEEPGHAGIKEWVKQLPEPGDPWEEEKTKGFKGQSCEWGNPIGEVARGTGVHAGPLGSLQPQPQALPVGVWL